MPDILAICAQEDNIHLKIVFYMHSWALLNHYLSLLDTLGHFEALLGPFGHFWGPFLMKSPFKKFQHFHSTLVGGVKKSLFTSVRHSLALLVIFGHFLPFWALLGPFWALSGPFLGTFVMKSPCEKFQHFFDSHSSAGSGNHYSSLLDTLGPCWAILGHFGPFSALLDNFWALLL